jgi:hypothetical protein
MVPGNAFLLQAAVKPGTPTLLPIPEALEGRIQAEEIDEGPAESPCRKIAWTLLHVGKSET